MSDGFKTYLFEYSFGGKTWALDILATSEQEARHRLVAAAKAEFKGELVSTDAGLSVPIWRSLLNWLRSP
ncbi:hypothetical protein [Aminobacter sp. MDW-2]|uniref:hypothetical protein n=1 Tax=Aminobacter sp. MDW-2 TaxID=2666139 RepID=UPI0012AFA67C|nr:hypothetical protein [Aminobacter sp. MDW-2]MRX32789.1 hypothetical protein [Aminobacter sp. MDW-2]QNH34549.1 hypothetical protein H5P29_00930 [Aminobacter sp. MDW-2]